LFSINIFANIHPENTTLENLLSEVLVKDTAYLHGLYLTILAKNHIVLNKAKWGKIRKENAKETKEISTEKRKSKGLFAVVKWRVDKTTIRRQANEQAFVNKIT